MCLALHAAIVKELISFTHDKTSLRLLLAAPLIQLIIFSYAGSMEVRNVNVAVLDQDQGRWSQELTASVMSAGFVSGVIYIRSMDEFSELIDRRQVLMALQYPADFSRALARGESATVQVIIDGRRANAGQIALAYLRSITSRFGARLQDSSTTDPPGQAVVRQWFNPNLEFQWFIVPSLIGLMALTVTFIMTTLSIAREREMGTFDQMLVSPLSPFGIVLSKIIPALLGGCFLSLNAVVLAIYFFGIPFQGNVVYLALSIVVFLLAVIGIGLSISAVATTQQQALMGAFSLMSPMVALSGFITPVENMPQWLQPISQLDPLTHILVLIQGIYLKALPFSELLILLRPLLLVALLTLTTATLILRVRLH